MTPLVEDQEDTWKHIEQQIHNSNLNEDEKKAMFSNLLRLKSQTVNILITGATGSGKSSTINAIFNTSIAKVGYGVDPETMDIQKYEIKNLTLWDSPGLGDGKEADIRHRKIITNVLREKDINGLALIDVALVIIDGSSKDLGTSYELINEVIIPNMPEKNRILVAINQCDIAMKGKGWNPQLRGPDMELELFLHEKVNSIRRRIYEGTGVNIEPIYYSASQNYNISKLLSFIIRCTPVEKRPGYVNSINTNNVDSSTDDGKDDYVGQVKDSLLGSVFNGISDGAIQGYQRAGLAGGLIGGISGGLRATWDWLFG
ncbi:GTPase family protein [Paenibacillus sp. CAU 1782]